mmetsp:Transcript_14740/g.29757  ORF Transcript_14740/g.29757 Transcript_14740/m.29757 type:complete len:91 (-) Transcript_14740:451-723(-)
MKVWVLASTQLHNPCSEFARLANISIRFQCLTRNGRGKKDGQSKCTETPTSFLSSFSCMLSLDENANQIKLHTAERDLRKPWMTFLHHPP